MALGSESTSLQAVTLWSQPDLAERLLTTMSVPKRQRLDFWHDYVGQTIAGIHATPLEQKRCYKGEIRRRSLSAGARGGLDLLKVAADPQRVSRTSDLISLRPEDNWLLMVQDAGRCLIRQNGVETELGAGDMAFLDTSRAYEVTFPEQFRQTILRLPATVFRSRLPMRRDVAGLALSGRDALVTIARYNLLLLDELARAIDPRFLPGAAERALDHIALAMRGQFGEQEERNTSTRFARHFEHASGFIESRLHEPDLNATRVADAIGLSSGHLHEVFRNAAGMTIGDFIRDRRLARCRRDLADQGLRHQSITDIAFRWGFSEASSFSRAFRAAFQTTPRRYRQTVLHV